MRPESLHLEAMAAAAAAPVVVALASLRWPAARSALGPVAAAGAALVMALTGRAPLPLLAAVAVLAAGAVPAWTRGGDPTADAGASPGADGDGPVDDPSWRGIGDPVWVALVLASTALVLVDPGARISIPTGAALAVFTALACVGLGGVAWIGSARLLALAATASTVGVYLAVPDTEGAVALAGAVLPVAAFVTAAGPDADRWAGRSLAPFVPVLVVAVTGGSVAGRPTIVIGGALCLGLLVTLPVVALAARSRWVALPRRADLPLAGAQLLAAVVIARVGVVRVDGLARTLTVSAVALAAVTVVAVAANRWAGARPAPAEQDATG